jgi:hypothetical protein
MTTFLLDIWHDLREKRLWPVAVGLLVATIAVPVVLFKPTAGAPQNQAPVAGDTAALPVVALDQSSIDNSVLGTFDATNPFASKKDKISGPATGTTGAAGVAASGSTPLGDSLFGGSSGSSGGGTAGGSGGTVPGSSGGSGGGTRYFTYTVDVTFGPRGKTEKYGQVDTLHLLPDDKNPIVSFMGMADGAKTAVFFVVDPAMQADGEGECNPTPEDCRFVYLKVDDAQDEQTLTSSEGLVEYTLRLDAIHIKYLSEGDATGDTTPDKAPDTPAAAKRRQQYNLATHPLLSVGEVR